MRRSTRKIPKTSRVPRSPFVIFLAHFLKKIYAGCGALLFLKKGRNFDVQEDTERDIFDFKNFRKISKYFVNRVHKNCEPGSQNCEPGSQNLENCEPSRPNFEKNDFFKNFFLIDSKVGSSVSETPTRPGVIFFLGGFFGVGKTMHPSCAG